MTFEELLIKWNRSVKRGSQLRLANALGISEGAVSHWLKAGRKPCVDLRPKIAKILGISLKELNRVLDETKKQFQPIDAQPVQRPTAVMPAIMYQMTIVAVVASVSAENFNCTIDTVPNEYLPIAIPTVNHRIFALKVKGDCLNPVARCGEYVVCAEADHKEGCMHPVDDGQLAVIRISDECTLKRVYYREGYIELKSDNPKHKTIKINSDKLNIIGKVIVFCRRAL